MRTADEGGKAEQAKDAETRCERSGDHQRDAGEQRATSAPYCTRQCGRCDRRQRQTDDTRNARQKGARMGEFQKWGRRCRRSRMKATYRGLAMAPRKRNGAVGEARNSSMPQTSRPR